MPHTSRQPGSLEAVIVAEWVKDLIGAIRTHLPLDEKNKPYNALSDFPHDAQPGQRTFAWLVTMPVATSPLDEFLWGLVREDLGPVAEQLQRLNRALTASKNRIKPLHTTFYQLLKTPLLSFRVTTFHDVFKKILKSSVPGGDTQLFRATLHPVSPAVLSGLEQAAKRAVVVRKAYGKNQRDPQLDARDDWICDQVRLGELSYDQIIQKMKKEHPEWDEVSKARVCQILTEHPKRTKVKPPLPRRGRQ